MSYHEIIDGIGLLNLNRNYANPNHHIKMVNFFYELHKSGKLEMKEVRKAIEILTNDYSNEMKGDMENIAYYVSLIRF